MKVRYQISYNGAYLLNVEDALAVIKILGEAETFDGYGDNEKLLPPDLTQHTMQGISDEQIKKLKRRQVVESE